MRVLGFVLIAGLLIAVGGTVASIAALQEDNKARDVVLQVEKGSGVQVMQNKTMSRDFWRTDCLLADMPVCLDYKLQASTDQAM